MTKTKPQPKSGDVLLGCVHRPNIYAAHIFQTPGISFKRPDGSKGIATWIVLCDKCFQEYVVKGDGPTHVPLACDFTWRDRDDPIVYKDPS